MTDHILNVSIVTPQSTAYEGSALAVSVPGSKSPFQVLFNHAPIISSLDPGVLKVEDATNTITYFASREGFIEVNKNVVSIVVQELVRAEEIDLDAAEAEVASTRARAEAEPDRHARENARRELHWAEAKMRAAKMVR